MSGLPGSLDERDTRPEDSGGHVNVAGGTEASTPRLCEKCGHTDHGMKYNGMCVHCGCVTAAYRWIDPGTPEHGTCDSQELARPAGYTETDSARAERTIRQAFLHVPRFERDAALIALDALLARLAAEEARREEVEARLAFAMVGKERPPESVFNEFRALHGLAAQPVTGTGTPMRAANPSRPATTTGDVSSPPDSAIDWQSRAGQAEQALREARESLAEHVDLGEPLSIVSRTDAILAAGVSGGTETETQP